MVVACRLLAREIVVLQMTVMDHSNAAMGYARTLVITAPQPLQAIQTMMARLSRITVNFRAFVVGPMVSVSHAVVMRKTHAVKANVAIEIQSNASQLLNIQTQNMEVLKVAT